MIYSAGNSPRKSTLETILPDLTPMLDVMFILLVFLILTANSVPYAIDISLPSEDAELAEAIDNRNILLTIYQEGTVFAVNGKRYESFEVASKAILKLASMGYKRVVLAGDKDAALSKLMQALVFLQNNGLQTADIMVDKQ